MPSRSCQDGGIVFGDWKLFPVDALNWELCHRHEVGDTSAARRAGTVGRVQWNRLGRYYSYGTFANAIRYAADCELKAEAHGSVMELEDALHEYERITQRLAADVARALEGRSDG
jgi:hypothetical protein